MKKILITGAGSYIGTSFETYIKENFPGDYVVDTVDMIDGSWREKSFSGYDSVFHVAGIAHSDNVKISEERAKLYYAVNTDLTAEVAQKAKNDGAKYIFVDFHAEATSEKRAMGFYLDGRITAIFGTHTHVQTADAQVLPCGTGYITDLGMTGVINSTLGVKNDIIINRLRNSDMSRFEQASGECMLNGCVFDVDEKTGLTKSVKLIYK